MMRYTWKRILTGIVSLFLLATVHFFSRKADTGKSVSKRRRFGAGCGSCGRRIWVERSADRAVSVIYGKSFKRRSGDFLSGSGYIGGRDYRTGSSAYGVARTFGIDRISDRRYGMRGVLCRVGKKGSEKGNRIIRNAGGGHSRFCRCDSSVNGIQCKIKMVSFVGFIFFFTLYFTGYGIVALSDGCDHPNDRTCIG